MVYKSANVVLILFTGNGYNEMLMRKSLWILGVVWLLAQGCDDNNNFVVFSIDDDITLGKQVRDEINSDPSYKLLPESQYREVYSYLYGIRDEILNSGEIAYKDKFPWELHIIQDDSTLNAFATPGGYIYVYTGLIKYLDQPDALAGVLGHEMAHADLRHSVRNLQKQYGVNILLSVVLGNNPNTLEQIAAQIAGGLAGLKFSREFETDADTHAVEYLSHSHYACNGTALFFIKLTAEGNSNDPPEFLSTHPNPENRIENINKKVAELKCSTTLSGTAEFERIKKLLP
jgi:predicted Zn-dependent protease